MVARIIQFLYTSTYTTTADIINIQDARQAYAQRFTDYGESEGALVLGGNPVVRQPGPQAQSGAGAGPYAQEYLTISVRLLFLATKYDIVEALKYLCLNNFMVRGLFTLVFISIWIILRRAE